MPERVRHGSLWPSAACISGLVEALRIFTTDAQAVVNCPQLWQAFFHALPNLTDIEMLHLAEQAAAQRVIDRAAVIRIHQAKIPQLGALIKIGNSR